MNSLWARLVIIGIIIIIAIGGIYFAYKYFTNNNPANVKYLTITSSGKFDPSSIKLDNNSNFRIKNNNKVNETVKKSSDDSTVVELKANSTSKDLNFKNDTQTTLYLAADTNQKATVTFGKPTPATQTNSKPSTTNNTSQTQPAVKQPANSVSTGNNNNKPLPNTGPGDIFLYPLLSVIGLFLVKLSDRYWKLTAH